MAVSRAIEIHCDWPSCDERGYYSSMNAARQAGWSTKQKDFGYRAHFCYAHRLTVSAQYEAAQQRMVERRAQEARDEMHRRAMAVVLRRARHDRRP